MSSLTVSLQLLKELGSCCFRGTVFFTATLTRYCQLLYYLCANCKWGKLFLLRRQYSNTSPQAFKVQKWLTCTNTKAVLQMVRLQWNIKGASALFPWNAAAIFHTHVNIDDDTYPRDMICSSTAINWLTHNFSQVFPTHCLCSMPGWLT